MAKGKIAGKMPEVIELEPGEYFWCKCGESKNQPYCDGSHAGTAFEPLRFEVKEKKRFALCTCKQTDDDPFCDGSHTGL